MIRSFFCDGKGESTRAEFEFGLFRACAKSNSCPAARRENFMRIFFGLLLIGIGFVWGAIWSGGASLSTPTGAWNSTTWALMGVAAAGLLPAGLGIYLIGTGIRRIASR